MGWTPAAFTTLLLTAALVPAGAHERSPGPPATFPPELRGAWFPDDAAGRAGCAAHRHRATPRDELDWGRIVGAIMIGADRAHHVSDYGEGDVDRPLSVVPTGRGRWRLTSRVGIDGEPDPGEPPTVHELRLANGRLQWRTVGDAADARPTYVFCSRRLPGDGS